MLKVIEKINKPENIRKLLFDKKQHISSWEHYLICYNYTLFQIFHKGLQDNYPFDCRGRAILFLLRHSLELTIKYNLKLKGKYIPNTHVFEYLIPAFGTDDFIPKEFIELLKSLNYSSDGSCFRYYKNNNTGTAYFKVGETVEFANILLQYSNIPKSESFFLGNLCEEFDYNDNHIKWSLTHHIGVSLSDGQVRNEYDLLINYIVEGILHDGHEVNKIYLPLLFLIRHGLELGLKSNLNVIKANYPDKISDTHFDMIHSISKLYSIFSPQKGFLSKVNLENLSTDTKKQFDLYSEKFEALVKDVNQIDSNSQYFRFPVDLNGNKHPLYMKGDGLYKMLKMYYETDVFLSFTIDVLKEEGAL